jgi:putative methionine-R-sulfoxide reductase with GAF domain
VSTSSAGLPKAAVDRLRDIETVTHAGLAHLGVEELLVELLDRVRNVLDADTAAVLLLDGPNDQLIATAARGIEEEVYQGARVPLGRGFAGRIATTRRPAAIVDVADADVVNPVLRENGVRSLLGVPLLAGGELLGVLHVGSIALRHFDDQDAELLQMVADRIALAVTVVQSDTERKASTLLQRSLLPQRLPRVPGLDVGVRYIAGGGGTVGGDWYDLFTLPTGRVCIAVGDVVGRGLRAAAVMGRLRSSLRAHALGHQGDPALVIDLVDRQLRHFDPGEMATVVVAVLDPSFDRLHLSSAGHPAPLLAAGDGPARYVDVAHDPPLGVTPRRRRRAVTIDLPPGAVVSFYTDGLVERRGQSLEDRLDLL